MFSFVLSVEKSKLFKHGMIKEQDATTLHTLQNWNTYCNNDGQSSNIFF